MPSNPNPVTGLPLTGGTLGAPGNLTTPGTVTTTGSGGLSISGLSVFGGGAQVFGTMSLGASAGNSTSASAPLITPTNANGTAAQLSDTTRDYMLYLSVGTAGTALSVAIGPTAGVANTIYTASTATAGQSISFRLPAGWFWKWSATTATLAEQTAIGC